MIKIGINGFGRIGRLVFRIASRRKDVEVVAVNDLLDIEHLAYLLRYDSVHGRFPDTVEVSGNELIINGRKIRVTAEKNPQHINWKEQGVYTVIDCSGAFKEKDQAVLHLEAGASKVVLSSPSKSLPMYVMGVNHKDIQPEDQIISNASCTTNCLAPMVKILHDGLGVAEALMTTIHAVTASQFTVDQPSKRNYRQGRSALNNIIPTSTGAATAVTKVIPELKGKLTGMAFRVPVADVSVVDLTVRTEKPASYEEIKGLFKHAAENEFKGIINYTEDEVVSQDFVSDPYICTFDAGAGMALNDNFFKLIGWYDNEYGYADKLVDLAVYFSNLKK